MPYVPTAKELAYADGLLFTYVASVAAASVAEAVTYPLDLTKTRLQIQGELANRADGKVTRAPYRGMFATGIGIVQEEGFMRLWQGMPAALCRHVIYSGTRIVCYQSIRDNLFHHRKDSGEKFPLWQGAISGVLAGSIAQFFASPADLVKVQIQMEGKRRLMGEPSRVAGLVDAFVKVLAAGGVRGLWKGSVPNVQRAALVNLGDLTTYDFVKQLLLTHTSMKDDHFTHVSASFCAGLVAATMGTPADVIKTRVMNQPTDEQGHGLVYKNSIDCLRKTISNEGFFALYKGFMPVWLRMAPWSLTFWLSFEEIRRVFGASQF